MASGSRGRVQTVSTADALETLTNPDLARLPAVDLVVHLHRDDSRGSDFADVALVLAVRERRLAEAEARAREADAVVAGLRDRVRALELRVANAEALARGRTAVVALEDDESQAGDYLTASDDDVGAADELTGGEIRARDLQMIVVPEFGAAEVEDDDTILSPIPLKRIDPIPDSPTPSPIPLMRIDPIPDSPTPSPIPLMRIDPIIPVPVTAADPALPDELNEESLERTVENVAVPRSHGVAEAGGVDCQDDKVSEPVARKRKKKPASEIPLPLDDLSFVTTATAARTPGTPAHSPTAEATGAEPHQQGATRTKTKNPRIYGPEWQNS